MFVVKKMQPSTTATQQREKVQLEPVTPGLLADVVRRIVAAVDPDKIILFGSCARGTLHETSDIDLYIIKSGDYNHFELQGEVYELLADIRRDFDVLVRTPEEMERALASGNTFVRRQVLERGRMVYERATETAAVP
jgi:predicted nucleotidyltransferase